MNSETKNCQSCKGPFVIEPDDFAFYEKIKVPPPTFCPQCRRQRRMSWRNERTLYRRTCDLCQKNIVSMYPADTTLPVYCRECWYSDKWDAASFARDFDPTRPFFEQYKELLDTVPQLALWQRNVVNSEYSNMTGESKNVYLSASVVVGSENVFYSRSIDASFNIADSYNITSSDSCYENIDGEKNYRSHFLILSRNCLDSRFLIDCVNCKNCILSSNLRNKEYVIRNKQCTKEEYQSELAKMNFGSRTVQEKLRREFAAICRSALYRFANIIKSPGSTGNNLLNAKNSRDCFDAYDFENARYCYRAFGMKDIMDFDFGATSELMYEYSTGSEKDYNTRFSFSALGGVRNAEYIHYCISSGNLFGCVGLRHKQYAILNKVYEKEEFERLRVQIIEQMDHMPFTDRVGRVYRYGEYPPAQLSPFGYNETVAFDFIPLTKEEAVAQGYCWRDPEEKNFPISMPAATIPDDIQNVDDSILKEIIGCAHEGKCQHRCALVFRLIPDEVQFYKKNILPLPDRCPNCRYYERTTLLTPLKLWGRPCMCDYKIRRNSTVHPDHADGPCPNTFATPYAPERPEVIYCERCYQTEVA